MVLNPQIVFRREFDGSGLLFQPDTGEVFALNPTAAAICELIAAGERDEAELLNSLARSTRCRRRRRLICEPSWRSCAGGDS